MRNKVAKRLRKAARIAGRQDKKYIIIAPLDGRIQPEFSEKGTYRQPIGFGEILNSIRETRRVELIQCDRQYYQMLKKLYIRQKLPPESTLNP